MIKCFSRKFEKWFPSVVILIFVVSAIAMFVTTPLKSDGLTVMGGIFYTFLVASVILMLYMCYMQAADQRIPFYRPLPPYHILVRNKKIVMDTGKYGLYVRKKILDSAEVVSYEEKGSPVEKRRLGYYKNDSVKRKMKYYEVRFRWNGSPLKALARHNASLDIQEVAKYAEDIFLKLEQDLREEFNRFTDPCEHATAFEEFIKKHFDSILTEQGIELDYARFHLVEDHRLWD